MQDPIRLHKDVWVMHPEHNETAIAKGRSGAHYKMAKSRIPFNRPCKVGVQWVHIEDVFLPSTVPMYAGKQKSIRIMEDAVVFGTESDGWVMWNCDYLREVV